MKVEYDGTNLDLYLIRPKTIQENFNYFDKCKFSESYQIYYIRLYLVGPETI